MAGATVPWKTVANRGTGRADWETIETLLRSSPHDSPWIRGPGEADPSLEGGADLLGVASLLERLVDLFA